jgi:hypothetical protein
VPITISSNTEKYISSYDIDKVKRRKEKKRRKAMTARQTNGNVSK